MQTMKKRIRKPNGQTVLAVQAVLANALTIYQASQKFRISTDTIKYHVKETLGELTTDGIPSPSNTEEMVTSQMATSQMATSQMATSQLVTSQMATSQMATSQLVTSHDPPERVLKCTMCTKVFINPCTLACEHIFCRNCVVNYTQSRPEAIGAKSLICPFCNKMTKVPELACSVEEFAEDIKPSIFIQGPDSIDTTLCELCKEIGETTPSTVQCSVCDEALCQLCITDHSRIHEVTDFCTEEKVERPKAMCIIHPQECIEFLCQNCKKTICNKCTLYHTTCDTVVNIKSQIGTMRTDLMNKEKTLSKKQKDMKSKTDELKSTLDIQMSQYKQMEENIMSLTKEVIKKIKVKERKLLDDLKEISDSHIRQLNADISSRELSAQMCQEEVELIKEALRCGDDKSVYELYESCEAGGVDTLGDMFPVLENRRITRVQFLQDNERVSKALDDIQLGGFDVRYDAVVDLTAHPVLQDTINVRLPETFYKEWIADVKVVVVDDIDMIVVTDRNNSNLNSFYTKNMQLCHNTLNLSSPPWSLTKMTHNSLAVTVPGVKQIIIVKVSLDLELVSTMQSIKQYWGITCLNPSQLAAGSKSPPCIDVLDLSGNVLHSINPNLSANNILLCPNSLCTTRKGNILVCDGATRCVMCLTPKGEIVFHYKPSGETALKCPQGITSTCQGDILITDFSKHSVIHLTEAGEFVRDILTSEDGIEKPQGVDVDGQGLMYVCLQNQDAVKIYRC